MDQTVDQSGVEILGLLDNQTLTVGSKRNKLLDIATGDYITFIDDDDRVTSDYISEIMKALAYYPGVDVINYDLMLQHGGLNKEILCTYDKDVVSSGYVSTDVYIGPGSHTNVWRRDLVKDIRFKDVNFGEDMDWAERAAQKAKTQHKIERVLYHYNFSPLESETRDEWREIENKLRKLVLNEISP